MSEVRLTGVGVSYGDSVAVRDVSLVVASGQRLAILGPSGCGKSSLLRAVAGLEPLAAGTVSIGGRELAGVPTHRRGVGLMFQDHALFPHLDVAGNVGFGLRLAKWPRERSRERVSELLDLVGLSDRSGSDVSDLSGGEQQRVALARTLATEPKVVLLDEPLGSLDRVLREELVSTMVDVFDVTGATVVFVTHDQSEAFALGDRVAVMRAGRVRQVGTQPELWGRPADSWVAGFLGMRNLFEVGSGVIGPDEVTGPSYLLRPDLLELRPRGFLLDSSGPHRVPEMEGLAGADSGVAPVALAVPVTVTRRVFRGGFWAITVDPSESRPGAASVEVWVMGTAPQPGDHVELVVPPEAIIDLPDR